jgi:hypothetical protein
MRTTVIAFLMLAAVPVFALDAQSRHSTGGEVGPNGLHERAAFKLNKVMPAKDVLSLFVDLGAQKFDSNHPEGLKLKTVVMHLGSQTASGTTDDKAASRETTFKLKLVANGAGLKIDLRKSSLTALLSELMGRSGDVDLLLTIAVLDAPGAEQVIYTKNLGLDIVESTKALAGKG